MDLVSASEAYTWKTGFADSPQGVVRHKSCRLIHYTRRKAFYGGSETFLLRKHPLQRKLFYLPRQRVPFIGLLTASLVTGRGWLSVASLSVPLVETLLYRCRLQKFGAKIPFKDVFLATAAITMRCCFTFAAT